MLELSPSSSSEERTLCHQLESSADSAYSPTTLSKTGSDQANILQEMNFSMTSNLLFFAGAFCQTVVPLWDYKYNRAHANDMNEYDDDDNYVLTRGDEAYYLLYSLGPLLLFCKAVVDIRLSVVTLSTKRREYGIDAATKEEWLNLAAAILFCLGAVFATYDTLLYDVHEDQDSADDDYYLLQVATSRRWFGSEFKMDEVATHFYLASAVIYVVLHAGCCRGCGQDATLGITSPTLLAAHRMMLCGSFFFVAGAFVDVVLSYFYDPQILDKIDHDDAIPATDLGLSKADLASSILWNIAPALYIFVDVHVQRHSLEQTRNSALSGSDSKEARSEVIPFV